MNNLNHSFGKHSMIATLSLGFMILGIGCTSWALFHIAVAPNDIADIVDSMDVIHSLYSIPTAVTAKLSLMTGAEAVSGQSDYSPTALPVVKSVLIKHLYDEGSVRSGASLGSPAPIPSLSLYPIDPVEGEKIGSLTIPALKKEFPIYQGTTAKVLKNGVGHFTQSVLPGEMDNCVLSGHRDTIFRKVGQLKIGDLLIVKTSAGSFAYAVTGTRIVHADDKTVIVPTDHAVLTVTTCYPFYYVGDAPDRYIIRADMVKDK